MIGKKGKIGGMEGMLAGIVVVAMLFFALVYTGTIPLATTGAGPGQLVDEDTGEVIESTKCTGGDTQSLDLNAHNFETGAALTEGNNVYYLPGSNAPLSWTQGTALTGLTTGEDYEFAVGPSTTASNEYDNSYGPHFLVNDLSCIVTRSIPLFADDVEGDLTAVFLDEYGQPDDASPVAGTDLTVGIQWYTNSEEYFGNPWIGMPDYLGIDWSAVGNIDGLNIQEGTSSNAVGGNRPDYPNTICFDYNKTTWDAIDWVKVTLQDGSRVEMDSVSMPQRHTVDSTGDGVKCFEAPVLSSDAVTFDVRLDPDDSSAASTDDITASIYAGSWGLHTDDLTVVWGVEDNDGNALGTSDEDTIDLDFTA